MSDDSHQSCASCSLARKVGNALALSIMGKSGKDAVWLTVSLLSGVDGSADARVASGVVNS